MLSDSVLAKVEKTQLGWRIVESVPLMQGLSAEVENERKLRPIILSTVTLDTIHQKITVERAPLARPIYYYVGKEGKSFYCSTHVFLLKKFGVTIAENVSVLPEFFIYGYVMPPATLYANIKRLSFGQSLHIKINGTKCLVKEEPSFSLQPALRERIPLTRIIHRILTHLKCTIEPLKVAKENLAVLLSGGLDSSILAKLSKDVIGAKQTFSTGYPFKDPRGNLERKYAITASSSLETDHVYYEATASEFIKGIIEATAIAEEPIHFASALLHLLFRSGLPNGRKIVVCGSGADSMLGGQANIRLDISTRSPVYLFAINPIVRMIVAKMSKLSLFSQELHGLSRWLESLAKTNAAYKRSIKDPFYILWSSGAHGNNEWVTNKFKVTPERIIKSRLDFVTEQIAGNPGMSLHDLIAMVQMCGPLEITHAIWSKLAEDTGKIIVFPFMNTKLITDAFSASWGLKLRKHKFILRRVARTIGIPEFIIRRRKLGMEIDPKIWAVRGGVLEPLIPLCLEVFDKAEFRATQSPEPEQSATFWHMLSYAIWKQIYIEGKSTDSLLSKLALPRRPSRK